MGVYDDDFVKNLVFCLIYDMLLFFMNIGKVYWVKGYEIFEYGRIVKGILVINLLGIDFVEKI